VERKRSRLPADKVEVPVVVEIERANASERLVA
jgi:hypothetical protein